MAGEPDGQHGNDSRSIDPLTLSFNDSSHQHNHGTVPAFIEQHEDFGNSRISADSSAHHHDYEIVVEPSVRFEDAPPPSQNSSSEESTDNNSEENVAREGYSSLHRDTSSAMAQPSFYTKLQLYANNEL